MKNPFWLAGASIPGTDHTQPGKPFWKNNQDAYFLCHEERFSIGVIADGCGAGASSEVGAKIGVRIFAQELRNQLADVLLDAPFDNGAISWHSVTERFDSWIRGLAESMGGKLSRTVEEFFLFSIVGFVITPGKTFVFHCGDGTYAVNGEITKLGPFPGNAPPYLAYRTLRIDPIPEIQVVEYETAEIRSIAVATDGIDYVPNLPDQLAEWVSNDRIFSNPDALRRQLAIMNRERIEDGMLVPGPLRDDTTVLLAKRGAE